MALDTSNCVLFHSPQSENTELCWIPWQPVLHVQAGAPLPSTRTKSTGSGGPSASHVSRPVCRCPTRVIFLGRRGQPQNLHVAQLSFRNLTQLSSKQTFVSTEARGHPCSSCARLRSLRNPEKKMSNQIRIHFMYLYFLISDVIEKK